MEKEITGGGSAENLRNPEELKFEKALKDGISAYLATVDRSLYVAVTVGSDSRKFISDGSRIKIEVFRDGKSLNKSFFYHDFTPEDTEELIMKTNEGIKEWLKTQDKGHEEKERLAA